MLVRPDAEDFRVISYYLGRVLLVTAAFVALPLAWALIGREWAPASSFVLTAGAFAFLGVLASRRRPAEPRLDWSHGMVVVALTWLIVPALGSVPLALSGHFANPLDAGFDAMSGLTTTGLSLLQDLDHLAPSLNFWRHLLHFMGGQGMVLAAVAVFAGGVGLSLFYGEAREERFLPSVGSTGRFIWWASVVHLVFGVAGAGVGGLLRARASLRCGPCSTGYWSSSPASIPAGFAPQSTSIGYYHSAVFEAATAVFMVAGAMSFGLHYALWRGPRRLRSLRNLETRTLAFTLFLTAGLAFLGLAVLGLYRSVPALARQGLFHVLSAHTGTGFATVPSSELVQWGGLAFAGIALAMALGGMASSTAGGVKALRVGLALKMLKDQVKAVLLPDRAVISQAYYQGGRKRLTPALAQAVLLVSLLYVALYLARGGGGPGLRLPAPGGPVRVGQRLGQRRPVGGDHLTGHAGGAEGHLHLADVAGPARIRGRIRPGRLRGGGGAGTMMARRRLLVLAAVLAPALLFDRPGRRRWRVGPGPPRRGHRGRSPEPIPEAYTTMGVVVRGELVGDFGERSDGTVWTQLNGDPYVEAPLLAGGSLAGRQPGHRGADPAGVVARLRPAGRLPGAGPGGGAAPATGATTTPSAAGSRTWTSPAWNCSPSLWPWRREYAGCPSAWGSGSSARPRRWASPCGAGGGRVGSRPQPSPSRWRRSCCSRRLRAKYSSWARRRVRRTTHHRPAITAAKPSHSTHSAGPSGRRNPPSAAWARRRSGSTVGLA